MAYGEKHPLQHKWTIWYLDGNKTKNWEDCLLEVGSFNTVEDFWCLFDHIRPASGVKNGCDYSLFKEGIRPMWEDDANVKGGCWLVSLEKRLLGYELDDLWLDMALSLIGGMFEGRGGAVNGATMSIRSSGNRLGLWLGSGDSQGKSIIQTGLRLKEVLNFGPTWVIKYQLHSDCISSNASSQAIIKYYI